MWVLSKNGCFSHEYAKEKAIINIMNIYILRLVVDYINEFAVSQKMKTNSIHPTRCAGVPT